MQAESAERLWSCKRNQRSGSGHASGISGASLAIPGDAVEWMGGYPLGKGLEERSSEGPLAFLDVGSAAN